MLILKRKVGDSFEMSGGINVIVKEIDRGVVTLGIDAPPEIKIQRSIRKKTLLPTKTDTPVR